MKEREIDADLACELRLARESEADCTIGAGAGPGEYTREIAERLRARPPATNAAAGVAITIEELAAVKALCDRSSPGPWQACDAQPDNACACKLVWSVPRDLPVMSANVDGDSGCRGDVAFVAALRMLVPQLVAEIERLRAEVAAMRPVVVAAVVWHNLGKLDQVHISVLSKGEEVVDSAVDTYLESLDACITKRLEAGDIEQLPGRYL